ncbi:hypothetical protein NE237_022586 [Protea cynaroides]|uniref:Uncharacterized protein n=1 Tax=Protea cynaroides TaxID=273540 RepID=A0A9Q0HA20_9MAGN|nr:hypothetical protein NE237_022586 [Protea cynaroides]
MDIKKVFHMIGGIGETSYAANSSLQKGAIDMVKHITTESIVELYLATAPQNLVIADLGCSSGPNTLSVIGEIIDAIDRARLKFMVPVTLYDEDGKSMNKGKIYISESSPHLVSEAYLIQFQEDFSLFLRSRSLELKSGGRMVLILLGRTGPHHTQSANALLWELLSRSFGILISRGDIDEEKLNSFDTHFYAPSQEEIEEEVRKEGSFAIDRLEVFEMRRDIQNGSSTYGTTVATTVRAIQESMIRHHFGEHIVNDLFEIYGRLIDEEMTKGEIRPIASIVAMRKRL